LVLSPSRLARNELSTVGHAVVTMTMYYVLQYASCCYCYTWL